MNKQLKKYLSLFNTYIALTLSYILLQGEAVTGQSFFSDTKNQILIGAIAVITIITLFIALKFIQSDSKKTKSRANNAIQLGKKKAAAKLASAPKKPIIPPPAPKSFAPPKSFTPTMPSKSPIMESDIPPMIKKEDVTLKRKDAEPPSQPKIDIPKHDGPPAPLPPVDKKAPLFDAEKLDSSLDALFSDSTEELKTAEPVKSPLFDPSKIESSLDDLFPEPKKAETKPAESKKQTLFDSDELDLSLDALFSEAPKAETKPAEPQKQTLFDADKLESSLDALFSEAPKAETKPAEPQKQTLFDADKLESSLDALFSEAPKAETKPAEPQKQTLFDADKLESSLDALFSEAPKQELKAETLPSQEMDTVSLDALFAEPTKEQEKTISKKDPLFDTTIINKSLDELFATTEDKKIKPETNEETLSLSSVELSSDTVDLSSFLSEPSHEAPPPGFNPPVEKAAQEEMPILSNSSAMSSNPVKKDTDQKSEGLLSIGKLLVDQGTLEQIIKTAEKGGGNLTTTKIISAIKGQSLDILLSDINRIEGVMGSLIVGKDGLVIASTMPTDIDKDLVGALTSSIFSNVDIQTKRMQRGLLKRMVLDTNNGLAVLAEVEMGTLVVFSKHEQKFDINNVLTAVNALTGKA